MDYNDSIIKIKGIGEKTQKTFRKIGIETVQDLLEHYPRDYEEFGMPMPIAQVSEGSVATIEAYLGITPRLKRVRHLQILNVQVRDSSGTLLLTWFNMPFLMNRLSMGTRYLFRGKVGFKNGVLVMEQPQIFFNKEDYYKLLKVLQPIYPLTEGISNKLIIKSMHEVHNNLKFAKDYIPRRICREYSLMDRTKALKEIHFPKDRNTMKKARERLAFDEFFLYSLALRRMRDSKTLSPTEYPMKEIKECDDLIDNLPYSLTKAQQLVWGEIKRDMTSELAMNRLIQGDVGSGKTILAVLALLMAVKNGYQASIMVPTEVLAKQHYKSFCSMLSELDLSVCLLVGSMTAKEKNEAYERIREHKADIIVGTHALIQEKVEYDNLALVITDEQHRFGVKQREELMTKGKKPHVLVMSATPIPRTLAIILYGDLDISIVDELPARRLPIKNCVVNTNYRPTAYRFIENQVALGRQAYVICPMVEESEMIEAENVIDYTQQIKEAMPSHISIEYLHGKMRPKEKNNIMERFAEGEIHVLVSTTVVEVGVNVQNATVMMVENAERFGLAQLHQLRGRVGRGEHQSYCIFVCGTRSKEAKDRLEILNKSNDGFYIAEEDLKLRGPGDLFGIRQSGDLEFKIGNIYTDASILKLAAQAAKSLDDDEAEKIFMENPHLEDKILNQSSGTL
ncbi:MAG: ATP-dependent DNA helicase RecG [Anaerolineaceae bacterium]|nr:MAG: ATP-dependent DNA helicase RecG [Anaerolineaceae bacterium]